MTRSGKSHDKIRQGGRSQAFRGEREKRKEKGAQKLPITACPLQPRLCTAPWCRDVTVMRCDPCDTAEKDREGGCYGMMERGPRPTATAEGQLLFLLFLLLIYPSGHRNKQNVNTYEM